jgi:aminoglycoside 3-N-acetyltransferase
MARCSCGAGLSAALPADGAARTAGVRTLDRDELVAALRAGGLTRGDLVHVQSDLRSLGPIDTGPDRESMLSFYLDAFREVIGEEGTLTVCTSFEDYGRYGVPFVREESPSRLGVFSEYVRTRPGAVRSLHPIISVTGIGPMAEEICGGAHYDGFGHDSPWARLARANAKFMGLGSRIRHSLTFTHYLEKLYGVPYQYTKVFTAPVISNGREVPGPFTMSVRYLDFSIEYDVSSFERELLRQNAAVEVTVGRFMLQVASADDILRVGVDALRSDRYFFLARPPRFRAGEYPADGPTGEQRVVYDAPSSDR